MKQSSIRMLHKKHKKIITQLQISQSTRGRDLNIRIHSRYKTGDLDRTSLHQRWISQKAVDNKMWFQIDEFLLSLKLCRCYSGRYMHNLYMHNLFSWLEGDLVACFLFCYLQWWRKIDYLWVVAYVFAGQTPLTWERILATCSSSLSSFCLLSWVFFSNWATFILETNVSLYMQQCVIQYPTIPHSLLRAVVRHFQFGVCLAGNRKRGHYVVLNVHQIHTSTIRSRCNCWLPR